MAHVHSRSSWLCFGLALGLTQELAMAQSAAPAAAASYSGIVVDANGAVMGPYYPGAGPYAGSASVLLQIAGYPVVIELERVSKHSDPSGMRPVGGHGYLYYKSPDCTGEPIAMTGYGVPGTPLNAIMQSKADGTRDLTIYLSDNVAHKDSTVNSYLELSQGICTSQHVTQAFLKISHIVVLSTLFTPPYHVR